MKDENAIFDVALLSILNPMLLSQTIQRALFSMKRMPLLTISHYFRWFCPCTQRAKFCFRLKAR